MIDYVTCRIGLPRPLAAHINGGQFVFVDELGQIERSTPLRKSVVGSFESKMQLRAPSLYEIELQGNPAKFVQGHNLYGPSCLSTVIWAALERIEASGVLGCSLASLGLSPGMLPYCVQLSRVDVTAMLLAANLGDVRSVLRALRVNGRLRDRGESGLPHAWDKGEGCTFGGGPKRRAAHRSLTCYSKGLDVMVHPLPDLMMSDADVREWTNAALRCEVRLGANYLRKTGLRSLENWNADTASIEWNAVMERVDMNGSDERPEAVDSLPAHLRVTYGAWRAGEDLKSILARPTFYRQRAAILKACGVDIAIPRAKVPTAEVVPIKRVIELRPAGRPAWADRIENQLRAAGAGTFAA